MIWHVKKNHENDTQINISYSCEQNETLDGIIIYNKQQHDFKMVKLSDGATTGQCHKTIAFLWDLIKTDKLSEKPYRICTG